MLMIVFLIVTIFIGHRFWEFDGAGGNPPPRTPTPTNTPPERAVTAAARQAPGGARQS
jgi:uncharacterized membrane protein YphA (DoxX/SURF4 family)